MRVLIVGGTGFLGRHIAGALVSSGHDVATLSRGILPVESPDRVEWVRGDREHGSNGLQALRHRDWDACVDLCGYRPSEVEATVEILNGRCGHYLFMSAVRVYGDPRTGHVTEQCPTISEVSADTIHIDDATYGPLKVACESVVRGRFPGRTTVMRPQVVVGPGDMTRRYSYWLCRSLLPEPMLAPGDGTDYLQVIDVRDLARFVVLTLERRIDGTFNLAGPRISWSEFVSYLRPAQFDWVDSRVLEAAELSFMQLPLYRRTGGRLSGLMNVCNERAIAAGLTLTDPRVTIAETRAASIDLDHPDAISLATERELIARSR